MAATRALRLVTLAGSGRFQFLLCIVSVLGLIAYYHYDDSLNQQFGSISATIRNKLIPTTSIKNAISAGVAQNLCNITMDSHQKNKLFKKIAINRGHIRRQFRKYFYI